MKFLGAFTANINLEGTNPSGGYALPRNYTITVPTLISAHFDTIRIKSVTYFIRGAATTYTGVLLVKMPQIEHTDKTICSVPCLVAVGNVGGTNVLNNIRKITTPVANSLDVVVSALDGAVTDFQGQISIAIECYKST